ncbi:hypothetical protein LCGC14_1271500 [marine sediment metagenome]|uniref:Large polyvalent protein associated domain-containing protein n=1 Tax=marine sediment metagenome TaxID=412755 RepID=A0A0F9NEK8_9ZZZZ
MDSTSIIERPVIDVNQIISDGFDLKDFIGAKEQKSLDQLKRNSLTRPVAGEVEDKYKMAAFIQSITSNRVTNLNANATMLSGMTGAKDTVSTWQAMKNGWRNGRNQMDRAEIRWNEMLGLKPINYELPPLSLLPEGEGWFESSLGAASNMLPMIYETTLSGAKYSLVTGLPAVGIAVLGGQAGPQVGLPEEIVTVPGAFAIFGGIGAVYGGAKRATEIEAGLMFDEILQMRGPNGERVNPQIAMSIAAGVGLVNGLIEVAQVDELIKTIPGAKKILRKGIKEAIEKAIKNKSLLTLAGKHAFRYGKTITIETTQEITQESSTIFGGELAKYLTNQANKGKIPHATVDEIMERYKDTAIQSIKAFSILGAPGHVGSTVVDVIDQQQVKVRDRVSPDTEISRVTDIRPRVDPRTLAEQAVSTEELTGLQVLPQAELEAKLRSTKVSDTEFRDIYNEIQRRRKKPVEVEEIPEIEEEQKIAATLPTKVSPRLYIGNVTRRMKNKFAEIFGKEEGDVKPFLEGPFPTKRTKIEMTSDQAMATLVMLEASLDQRLNDNLIRTENDLAQANADWGDIREIRKVLELPKTTRPFTVVRAVKPTVIVPSTITQRVAFSVQMSKVDKVTTTRIQQLNNVMARMRKAAKEGHAVAAKHFRELQYLRKQIQLHRSLVAKIKAEPSKNIDPFYAKAVEEIQSAIDFKAKPEAKEGLRKHLENNPDKRNEIPESILESLEKRDVESLSMAQLQQIYEEIQRLSKLGRLKSKLMKKQRKALLDARVKAATKSVKAARVPKLHDPTKPWTNRPLRLLDMLDGMKKFAGTLVEMFDTAIQDATDDELTHVDHRQQRAKSKLKELGLTLFHFARRRKVGDVTLSIDDMCGIYAGWMNEESRLALQHGGIEMESGKTLLITEEIYDQVVEGLTNEEKKWAEFIIEEYTDNWERIRNAFIDVSNKDLGRRPNYTKMRRIGVDKATSDDILAGFDYAEESDYRDGTVQVHDKFTKERQPIPPQYQLPIDPSLTRVWQGEVRKQEHYIAMAKLLKDLNAIVTDKRFADEVKNKFGESVHKALKNYLKRVANPDYYRSFDDIENLSRTLRKNTAVAYLAFNLLTVAKQGPSLALYAVNSSFSDLLMSAMQVAVSPKKTYEAILSHNRQIGHAAIVREMEELKHTNKKTWRFIVNRVGNAGLYGIYQVDRVVRVIGENAVINNQMRKGLSLEEATKKARQTSIRTQPAAASKDIAQLYANNEVLNWFTMFTNQLNQIYNIATYDIPAAWYNKEFAEVGRSVLALSIVSAWIWTLRKKELPDEREDILDAMLDQSLAAIPLVGSAALAGKDGWNPPTPSIFSGVAKTAGALKSGDMDKIMPAIFENTAILIGAPFVGTKRIYETAAEQDLWELIGGKD